MQRLTSARAADRPPAGPSAGLLDRPLVRRGLGWARWLPVLAAAVFAVLLAVWFTRLVEALLWINSDWTSPLTMSEALREGADASDVVFGTYASYSTVGVNLATGWLPFHRGFWELWPLLLSLAGVALLAWGAWRLGGRWAGVMAGSIGVSASTPVLETFVTQANHGPAYFTVCLFAAFLVFLVARSPTSGQALAGAGLVGLIAGANLASDSMLYVSGIAPFFAAALIVALRRWSRAAARLLAVVVATAAVAIVVSAVTTAVMNAIGLRASGIWHGSDLSFESVGSLAGDAGHTLANLLRVGNGDFFGAAVSLRSAVALALAGVTLVALGILAASAWRAVRAPAAQGDALPARELWLVYWGLAAVCTVAAVVVLALPAPGEYGARYLTPAFLAVAAVAPLWAAARPRREAAFALAATAFCAMSAVGLHRVVTAPPSLYQEEGEQVIALLESRGLERGYAGYWSAAPMSWNSGGSLQVLPVSPCFSSEGTGTLCAFPLNRVLSQYEPRAGTASFVVHSPSIPFGAIDPAPPGLGPPAETLRVGTAVVYVYDDDVAARFGAPIEL